jgi:large subunit ribosomal protein L25
MANTTLNAQKREGTGKGVARKLRQAGRVPAVVYGRDLEALHLSIDAHEADLLFRSIPVENTVLKLKVEGVREPFETLVREIQTHPYKETLIHVDFLRIQKGVAVEVDIPVHLVGVPIGVRENGGVLEQTIHDLPIRCVPSAIPQSIDVDVSGLDLHDVFHVADLQLGEGIEVTIPGDRTICSVAVPRAAVEAEEGEVEEGAEAAAEGEEPTAAGEEEEGGEG